MGAKFRTLRDLQGLSVPELMDRIYRLYGLKIQPSLMTKIENGKSEIQLKLFLALLHYYRLDQWDFLGIPQSPPADQEILILEEYHRNPDIRYTVDSLLQNRTNLPFLQHVKSIVRSAMQYLHNDPPKPVETVLKAASGSKKKP